MIHTMPRLLKIRLSKGQAAFLWGPGRTDKVMLLWSAFPDSLSYALLQTDLFPGLVRRPFLLREQLLATAMSRAEQ